MKWWSLEIVAVFRAIDRVIIPTTEGEKMDVILETERREIIHVWIASIINEELKNYDLSQGNVFIKPLEKKTSNISSNISILLLC